MTSSDGECGAVSCATVALVCPYVRCVCWFAAAAIADVSTDSRYGTLALVHRLSETIARGRLTERLWFGPMCGY